MLQYKNKQALHNIAGRPASLATLQNPRNRMVTSCKVIVNNDDEKATLSAIQRLTTMVLLGLCRLWEASRLSYFHWPLSALSCRIRNQRQEEKLRAKQ